jgi:tripartite-type tricarboxylate transporter receptor subunit TctC
MKIQRREFLHQAGAAALPAVTRGAWPQTYPTRTMRLIYPAGGGPTDPTDIAARLIGQWLSERLGQAVVIEKWPGGAGDPATEAVVRAPADGYTLLMVNARHTINTSLDDKLSFDFIRDIAPAASIYYQPFVLGVNPSVPAKTVPEFIADAKANPGKFIMASGLISTPQRVADELFKMMTGVLMCHVPYLDAQVMFDTLNSSIEYIRVGKLRALAVTTPTRMEVLPGIPTIGEFVPGYEARGWQGIGAPKNTPAEIINRLNTEINAALADPKFRARLSDLGCVPLSMTPGEFGRFIAEDTKKVAEVVKFVMHCHPWEVYCPGGARKWVGHVLVETEAEAIAAAAKQFGKSPGSLFVRRSPRLW